jgi:hypothetical protein
MGNGYLDEDLPEIKCPYGFIKNGVDMVNSVFNDKSANKRYKESQ